MVSAAISSLVLWESLLNRGDLLGERWVLTQDASVFLYGGSRLLSGEVPYRDFWDHKGPMIYVVNAVGLAIGGGSSLGVFAVEVAFLVIGGFLVYLSCRAMASSWIAFPLMTAYILSIGANLNSGNLTEEYAVLFVVLAIYAVTKARGGGGYNIGMVIGTAGAIAALFKLTYVATPAALGIGVVVATILEGGWTPARRVSIGGIVAFLAVVALATSYFLAAGALDEAIYANWTYQVQYVSDRPPLHLPALLSTTISNLSTTGLGIFALTGWAVALYRSFRPTDLVHRAVSIAVVFALPIEVYGALASGRAYPHYFMMLVPVAVLAAALVLREFATATKVSIQEPLQLPTGAAIALGSLSIAIAALPLLGIWTRIEAGHPKYEPHLKVVEYIQEHTSESDTVLAWVFAPWAYTSTGRVAPTRFFYVHPLFFGERSEDWQVEFVDDIIDHPPAIIVVSEDDPFTLENDNQSLHAFDVSGEPMVRLIQFVQDNYRFEDSGMGWSYYVLDQ